MPISLNQRSVPKPLSWNLTIDSTIVLVTGSMTIGSVMVQLVNRLDVSQDFSDYALWWSKANIWLANTKWTLDQYGIQSDAQLNFTSMHKPIRLQLPDLRVLSVNADFSVSVFAAVCKLCKDLGLRHAEELSLSRPPKVPNSNGPTERRTSPRRRRHNVGSLNRHNSMGDSLANNSSTLSTLFSPTTPKLRPSGATDTMDSTMRRQRSMSNLSKSLNSLVISTDGNLARTPITPLKNVLPQLLKPINLMEKSKLNGLWYDSSRSLMEQSTNENDLILLRFKYFTFYDLDPKVDAIRLNQLYEQAKWSILSEDIDCTEEEMMNFAALQLQIQIQSFQPSSTTAFPLSNDDLGHEYDNGNDDDIDRALERLQDSLLGTNTTAGGANANRSTNSLIQQFSSVGDLCDYLRLSKPRRFTFKTFKRYWFTMRDTQLTYYPNESQQRQTPIEKISLNGCEILPDVNISSKKYIIRLMIPSIDGMNETLIRCSTEEQYAKWMAAFRLASKGRSIGEPSYETERESILALLNMQRPSSSSNQHHQTKFDIQPDNFVSTKFVKKYKTKQLTERVLEAHAAVSNLDGNEAKLHYLKAWQALPEFGITTFVVKFKDSNKKEELLGIASNRLLRLTMTGDTLKIWWISRMRSWNVNWENKLVTIEFDGETIQFLPLHGTDSKCIHEFIGAYIFLAMRLTTTAMSDNNDPLRQETLFQRLTSAYT